MSSPEYFKKYYADNKIRLKVVQRDCDLRRQYGISLDEYNTMLSEQDGRCAICGEIPDETLAVDHDHKTGKVRGLLCFKCNTAIGLLKDNEFLLHKARLYLGGERVVQYKELVYTPEGWQEKCANQLILTQSS